MSLENLRVGSRYRHKSNGTPCELCGDAIIENHDNFECPGCKYVDFENHNLPRTGVYIRASLPDGKPYNADAAELDDASLATWVNERLDDKGKLDFIRILLGRRPFP